MEKLPWIAGALIAGVLLGAAYFGCLWLTVKRLPSARRPKLLMFSSLAVRLLVALAAFFGVSLLGFEPLITCFIGFLIGRRIMVRRYGKTPELSANMPPEPETKNTVEANRGAGEGRQDEDQSG
jgi:F1F0 ATPase subunit 2